MRLVKALFLAMILLTASCSTTPEIGRQEVFAPKPPPKHIETTAAAKAVRPETNIYKGKRTEVQRLLREYVSHSSCGIKYQGPQSFETLLKMDETIKKYDWSEVKIPREVTNFVRVRIKQKRPIEPTCLPPLLSFANTATWSKYFRIQIERLQKRRKKPRWRDKKRLQAIELLLGAYNREAHQEGLRTRVRPPQELYNAYHSIYKDLKLGTTRRKFLNRGLYLQYGSQIGDERAFKKSKELIQSFLLKRKGRRIKDAIYALLVFDASQDSVKLKEKRALIDDYVHLPNQDRNFQSYLKNYLLN